MWGSGENIATVNGGVQFCKSRRYKCLEWNDRLYEINIM